jgi:hypothetical protein
MNEKLSINDKLTHSSQLQRNSSMEGVRQGSFNHIYPGMLPTLGLNKYKNIDLALNQQNPYQVQSQTEKLLVFREREREFSIFNKLEKEG